MNELEDLIIYKQYVELIYYTHNILLKYPKSERFSLCTHTSDITYEGLECIIKAQKENQKIKRLAYLNQLDADLKILKVYIRVAYKKKYINVKNYMAWSKKLANITNLMGGWMKTCATQ